ncbi:coiled coil domain containing protein 148 [Echinococcus multilocularis]|uniref:Coiled coil domain containing protein 148 n=1 Tax=Echinococcus multilocularis TaxID=6211 RepID=A0A068XZX2_ECHMU|nr:coiled coil domain containing protein 148 [Echinococcus multilocularis]
MDARLKFRHLQPANVATLKAKIAQVNKDTTKTYEKLSLLARSRDSMHDAQMHRIHFVIWLDASRKQQETARNLLSDLKTLVYDNINLDSNCWDDKNSSLIQLVEAQSLELEDFKAEVIQPLNQLRLEIKESLQSNQNLRAALRDAYANIEAETFKLLQREVEIDAFPLASRMDTFERLRGEDPAEDKSGGIPPEAWQWDTHDEKFRADLLSEFVHLDAAFITKIESAKKEFFNLENTYGLKEWKMEDFHLVEFLWDVYNASETPQKRRNCIDFLKRLPSLRVKKPHAQLLDFFREHDVLKVKMEDIVLAWTRARQELADRIHVTLEDATEEFRKRSQEKANVEKQRMLCHQLAGKVQRWREEKAELEDLELRARESNRAAEMAREKERQAREDRRRQAIKNKVQTRRESKFQEKAEFEAAEHLRLEELRRVFDRQRRLDTRRLLEIAKKYLQQQSARRIEASEEATRQAEAMEARLEAIRVKVRPDVPDNPLRVFANTEAWRHHLEASAIIKEEAEVPNVLNVSSNTDKPITTFTETQLQCDYRTRLSTALFEAGLLNTNYARNLLSQKSALLLFGGKSLPHAETQFACSSSKTAKWNL